jgi:hypothetical protein
MLAWNSGVYTGKVYKGLNFDRFLRLMVADGFRRCEMERATLAF